MPLIEKRYAEALVDISVQTESTEAFQEEFLSVIRVYNEYADLRFLLQNPEIGNEAKKETVKKLFTNVIRAELMNFMMLLLDKGRMKFLPGIYEEFVKMSDKRKNILGLTIISVDPLEETQINRIKEKYKALYHASDVKVSTQIDKTVIGGISVKIGDKLIDGTLKGRLESLKEIIVKS